MSFLTPLYIAGMLAVSLPILFHLIRRMPHGRVPFSTVMFLEQSPPRITRRRRLDNWLLLLLRALALCLLALAFMRPYLRQTVEKTALDTTARRIVLLLDTSASMRRGNLWQKAVARAEAILEETTSADEVSILAFDRRTKSLVGFDEWSSLEHAARQQLAGQRIRGISPGWSSTHLGQALTDASESLDASLASRGVERNQRSKQIVLISDLQSGSRLNSLQTYQWPKEVQLLVERISTDKTTNAGLQFVAETGDGSPRDEEHRFPVRVANAADSTREQFRIRWVGAGTARQSTASKDDTPPDVVNVYVPPGQSRVVRTPPVPDTNLPVRLLLEDDDHEFDNVVHLNRRPAEKLNVLYFGSEAADDPRQAAYYVERAFPETRSRVVDVIVQSADTPLISSAAGEVHLVIATEIFSDAHANVLRQYVQDGGMLVFLMKDTTACQAFAGMIQCGEMTAEEASIDAYAMLTDINFDHPVFASFSDAQFADFTKVHIWKHRRIEHDAIEECKVLARFDDGDPAVLELPVGRGKVLVFTVGWHPEDNQLALSSKFVPMLNGILDYGIGRVERPDSYTVGDAVQIAQSSSAADAPVTIQLPDRKSSQLAAGEKTFTNTLVPGIYTVQTSPQASRFAVHLNADESKTSPMPVEKLESFGVRLTPHDASASADEAKRRQRQLLARELESRQKYWRWLIVGAIAVLVLETWLAGRPVKAAVPAVAEE